MAGDGGWGEKQRGQRGGCERGERVAEGERWWTGRSDGGKREGVERREKQRGDRKKEGKADSQKEREERHTKRHTIIKNFTSELTVSENDHHPP